MKIAANRLDCGFLYQKEIKEKALTVLRSGLYILENEIQASEKEFAAYLYSSN